jgi:hypothetical protein
MLPTEISKENDNHTEQTREKIMLVVRPAYAQAIHLAEQYWQIHQETVHTGEQISGLALCGTKKWLNRLTGNLALLR